MVFKFEKFKSHFFYNILKKEFQIFFKKKSLKWFQNHIDIEVDINKIEEYLDEFEFIHRKDICEKYNIEYFINSVNNDCYRKYDIKIYENLVFTTIESLNESRLLKSFFGDCNEFVNKKNTTIIIHCPTEPTLIFKPGIYDQLTAVYDEKTYFDLLKKGQLSNIFNLFFG